MDLYTACLRLSKLTIDATESLLSNINHDYALYMASWQESRSYDYLVEQYGEELVDKLEDYLCDICVEDPGIGSYDLACKAIDYIKYGPDDQNDEPPSFDQALYSSLYVTPYQSA